ncbi:SAM-dependent methyltransferase [Nonomuraea antimicrobica]
MHIVPGDVREPERVIAALDGVVDWSRPVALVLIGVLHFVSDEDDPHRVVAAFRERLAPGSLLVVSHATYEGVGEQTLERIRNANADAPAPLHLRAAEEIRALFDGTEPVEPGVVDVHLWRPDALSGQRTDLRVLGGVGRIS